MQRVRAARLQEVEVVASCGVLDARGQQLEVADAEAHLEVGAASLHPFCSEGVWFIVVVSGVMCRCVRVVTASDKAVAWSIAEM